MKKVNAILCVMTFLLSGSMLYGQSYWGPKLGATIANVNNEANGIEIDTKSNIDLQIGLALDLGITPGFSLQPEVTYLGRSYEVEILNQTARQTMSYIDLGALAKIRFGVDQPIGGYIGAGPFLNYAISGKIKVGNDENKIEFGDSDAKRTDLSVAGALGITFNLSNTLFYVDGRYILGLGDIDSSDNSTVKNRTIGLSAGLLLPF